MCSTCGCGEGEEGTRILFPGEEMHEHQHNGLTHEHDHDHPNGHNHDHSHTHNGHNVIEVEQNILMQNNLNAQRNRGYFEAKNILAINLVSSPGSGKTALLEKTIKDLKKDLKFYVMEGDQQTTNDAERIGETGVPVIQINTGSGCHLDADMVRNASKRLNIEDNSVLMIENVGNLVCPALFDLGENSRAVIMSTTEGEDKPLKYPQMFKSSDICIINKTDLLPYLDFDMDKAKEYALRVNPKLEFMEVSAKTGEGMNSWYQWLKNYIYNNITGQ